MLFARTVKPCIPSQDTMLIAVVTSRIYILLVFEHEILTKKHWLCLHSYEILQCALRLKRRLVTWRMLMKLEVACFCLFLRLLPKGKNHQGQIREEIKKKNSFFSRSFLFLWKSCFRWIYCTDVIRKGTQEVLSNKVARLWQQCVI